MARSRDTPLWAMFPDRGGYTVHSVSAHMSTILLDRRRDREGGRSQNLLLFFEGAMSGAPGMKGTSQFLTLPITLFSTYLHVTPVTSRNIIICSCCKDF